MSSVDDIYTGRVSFIKDVEGHELQVLEGAKNDIEKLANNTVELIDYENSKVPSFLKELGYTMEPIERPEKMFLFPSPRTYMA